MKIGEMISMMRMLYENDKEGYDDLWKAIQTLHNLGLVGENVVTAMVKEDRRLFEENN